MNRKVKKSETTDYCWAHARRDYADAVKAVAPDHGISCRVKIPACALKMSEWCSKVSMSAFQAEGAGSIPVFDSTMPGLTRFSVPGEESTMSPTCRGQTSEVNRSRNGRICPCGVIGRHTGLKSRSSWSMWVRIPPGTPSAITEKSTGGPAP